MASRPLPATGPKKCQTESKKSQNRLFFNYFDSFSTLFGLFGPRGRKGPGTHFRTLFATFGPKGPNDPCSGQKFSQGWPWSGMVWVQFGRETVQVAPVFVQAPLEPICQHRSSGNVHVFRFRFHSGSTSAERNCPPKVFNLTLFHHLKFAQ